MPYKDPQVKRKYDHARHIALRGQIHQQKRSYYLEHREEIKCKVKAWKATHKEASRDYFRRYHQSHRQEQQEGKRLYYAKHLEESRRYSREYRRQWRHTPRGRLNVAKGYVRAYFKRKGQWPEYLELRQRQYFLLYTMKLPCKVCGTFERREIHHIIPLKEGGFHDLDNLQVLCFEHHRSAESGIHAKKVKAA